MKAIAGKAIVRHTLTMYRALEAKAKMEGNHLTFRGQVTKVFASTGIGQSYYSEIFRQLEGQGCVTYIQRGSRSVDSVMVINDPPTLEGYIPPPSSPLTDPERYANMGEDVEALKTLVGGMNIALALQEVDRRLKRLEEFHNRQENSGNTTQSVTTKER